MGLILNLLSTKGTIKRIEYLLRCRPRKCYCNELLLFWFCRGINEDSLS